MGKPVHGWLIVDKAEGVTSTAIVANVRGRLRATKAGHAGTLDPLASGVLPIALGEATKTVSYVMNGSKKYRFTVTWGQQRDTDDRQGAILAEDRLRPTAEQIRTVLPRFVGHVSQTPPIYSAIRISGRRAYDMARRNETFTLQPRDVYIANLELVEVVDGDHAVFEVETGKGVYVRALARDMAEALGTVGYVSQLRRLAAGPFEERHAISLDNEKNFGHSESLLKNLLAVETALADIPALDLTEAEARRLQRGQPISALPVASRFSFGTLENHRIVCAMAGGKTVALAQLGDGVIKPVRVLNL